MAAKNVAVAGGRLGRQHAELYRIDSEQRSATAEYCGRRAHAGPPATRASLSDGRHEVEELLEIDVTAGNDCDDRAGARCARERCSER